MLLALMPSAAAAYQTFLAAGVHAVKLEACQVYPEDMVRTNTGRLVQPGHQAFLERVRSHLSTTHLGVIFADQSRKAISTVQITFTPRDAAGRPLAYYNALWTGDFEPRTPYDLTARGFKSIGPAPPKTASVSCTVARAQFSDGTTEGRGERDLGARP